MAKTLIHSLYFESYIFFVWLNFSLVPKKSLKHSNNQPTKLMVSASTNNRTEKMHGNGRLTNAMPRFPSISSIHDVGGYIHICSTCHGKVENLSFCCEILLNLWLKALIPSLKKSQGILGRGPTPQCKFGSNLCSVSMLGWQFIWQHLGYLKHWCVAIFIQKRDWSRILSTSGWMQ